MSLKKSIVALIDAPAAFDAPASFDAPAAFTVEWFYASLQHWHDTALLAEQTPLKTGVLGGGLVLLFRSLFLHSKDAPNMKKNLVKDSDEAFWKRMDF